MSAGAAESLRDPRAPAFQRARWPLEAGVLAAGAVFALGYLLGFVEGPLTGAIGGLGLMTFARALASAPVPSIRLWSAWVTLSSVALWLGSRWSSVDLVDLWGAQGVLGPTLLVGPTPVAAGSILLASAGVLALAVWIEPGAGSRARDLARRAAVAVPAALLLVSCAWGPAVRGTLGVVAASLGQWFAATLVVLGLGAALAYAARRMPLLSWLFLACAVALAVAGALLLRGVF